MTKLFCVTMLSSELHI